MTEEYLQYDTVKPSPLFEKLANDKVRCGVCERKCEISPGRKGFCKTKANIQGKLYTLTFGDISALESRPIEIKPFFHYYPGSTALTFSTFSCNFRCPWCQNFHLSRAEPKPKEGNYVPPQKMVDMALKYGDSGLCVSFQEPTLLFEYCLEVFPLAKEKGLFNCFVSNGYQTQEALKMLALAGLDGLKIDMKGDKEVYDKYCRDVDVDKIWKNAQFARKMGLHVEIVNLLITDVNDDEDCIDYIINNQLKYLDKEAPLHFTRYHPSYEFHNPATKIEKLEMAYEKAKKEGVLYPYLGNVLGHEYENTYCPKCKETVIKRYGHSVTKYQLTEDKKCKKCGSEIPIVGAYRG
ncbi:MAG: AmmeMemoRadiSam system radical SAM enzyme [Thermoplasmata archaeon]|nr:MAG: AmmeMemoRadiSam system radical SAM enzyme [Thermoplasmata archaeon]